MLIAIFFLLLLLSGLGIFYGFYKFNFPIYLLGAGLITILGLIVLSEGLVLDTGQTISDGETTFVTQPEVLTIDNSQTAVLLGYGCFYGGMFFLALATIIAIMWFWRHSIGLTI